jgi:hypothetical protein
MTQARLPAGCARRNYVGEDAIAPPDRALRVAQELKPDVRFDDVECNTAASIGQKRVRHVRDIDTYDIAYRLLAERRQARNAAEHGAATQP